MVASPEHPELMLEEKKCMAMSNCRYVSNKHAHVCMSV